jgi:Fe-S-cluster containining protein
VSKVDVSLHISSPAGVTTVRMGITKEPIRLAELARLVHAITNTVIDRCIETACAEERELSCRSGCSHCCKQLVPVSAPEAFLLADQVIALESGARDEVFARVDGVRARLDAAGISETLRDLTRDSADTDLGALGTRYFKLQTPCPFLQNDRCCVYEQRPVACRDFNVTSPSAWCAAPELHQIRKVETPRPMARPLAKMVAKLMGRPEELIPLSLAFEWVEANAELGMLRWPGHELFRAFAAEL